MPNIEKAARLAVRPLILLVTVLALGCGAGLKTYPVQGKVTFADGKALAGGRVELRSEAEPTKGMNASGEVDPEGNYTVSTWFEGRQLTGAVAGPHKVTVFPPEYTGPSRLDQPPPPSPVPLRYRSYTDSGLQILVEPEKLQYPLRLERK